MAQSTGINVERLNELVDAGKEAQLHVSGSQVTTMVEERDNSEKQKPARKSKAVVAELYLESSVFNSQAPDFFEDGFHLELSKPICFQVRVRVGNRLVIRKVEIVCSEDSEQAKKFSYGFKYVG